MMGPKGIQMDKVTFPTEFQTVLGILEIVKNKDKIEKVLSDLKNHADKANNLIEKVGKASEIEKLHAIAKSEADQTEGLIQEARLDAEKILSEAKEQAASLKSQAEETARNMLSHADDMNKQAIQREKDAKVVHDEVRVLRAQLESANQAQMKREADLDKRESEIVRKEAILKQLG